MAALWTAAGEELCVFPHITQCLAFVSPALDLYAQVLSVGDGGRRRGAPTDAGASTSTAAAAGPLLFRNEDAIKRLCRTLRVRALAFAVWPEDASAQRVFRVVAAIMPAGVDSSLRRPFAQMQLHAPSQRRTRSQTVPPPSLAVTVAAATARDAPPAVELAALGAHSAFTLIDGAGTLLPSPAATLVGHVFLGLVPFEPLPAGDAAALAAYTDALRTLLREPAAGGVDTAALHACFQRAVLEQATGGILAASSALALERGSPLASAAAAAIAGSHTLLHLQLRMPSRGSAGSERVSPPL